VDECEPLRLGDSGFLPSLHSYDKDNMDPDIVVMIKPFVAMPEFEPEAGGSLRTSTRLTLNHLMLLLSSV
jgi:hypothetical protein